MDTKSCIDCKKEFSLDFFYKTGKYFSSYCKVCHAKRVNVPEKVKEKTKKWKLKNPNYDKEYVEKNYSVISEYRKQYRLTNTEKHKKYMKKYREDNSTYYKNYRQENKEYFQNYQKQWKRDNGLQLKSKRIWNGTNTEYNLNDFLNNKSIVYFIGDIHGLYVKIGITSSIFSLSHRFRTIQGCNPMPLKLLGFIQDDNAAKLERRLHEQFKQYSRIGEWFVISPDISRYIKENCMHIELANTMIGETYLSLPSILADDMGY